jgi:hypothetical protein
MNKPIELREADFRRELRGYKYPEAMLTEFGDYWTEPDRAPKPKMRFEKEKTWHLGRRLARWARTGEDSSKGPVTHKTAKPAPKAPETDFDRLDLFIEQMKRPGVDIPFEDFGQWYEFMKKNRLLRPMSRQDCDSLLEIYHGDKMKCRCAVVKSTLDGYTVNEMTIKDILKIRERLGEPAR